MVTRDKCKYRVRHTLTAPESLKPAKFSYVCKLKSSGTNVYGPCDYHNCTINADRLRWLEQRMSCNHYAYGTEGDYNKGFCEDMNFEECTFDQCPMRMGSCDIIW